jgi:hypothetical protein
MSATQREHVIQVPDTPASEGDIYISGGLPDDPADEPPIGRCRTATVCAVFALVVVAVFVLFITLAVLDGPPTAYSAAITGAAVAASSKASPFNLTVHIKNPSRLSSYCVSSGTTAAVSYDGATIGAGILPMFCAGKRDENEVVVPVWGADVTLPLALQRREAVVDVVIQMPRGNGPHLLVCSVRVGHGLSPCTSDY